MSPLIEKIRLLTRQGHINQLRKFVHRTLRHFSSLSQDEQCVVLNALSNLHEEKFLMRYLDDEKSSDEIIEGGVIQLKKQAILSRAQMFFGCPNMAIRVTRRLEDIIANDKLPLSLLDKKRLLELLSTTYLQFALMDDLVRLKNCYPTESLPDSSVLDEYFEMKYLTAQIYLSSNPNFYIQKLEHLIESSSHEIVKNFAYSYLGSYQLVTKKRSPQELLKNLEPRFAKDKGALAYWLDHIRGRAEMELGNLSKAKSFFVKAYKQDGTTSFKHLSLCFLELLNPKNITREQLIFLRIQKNFNYNHLLVLYESDLKHPKNTNEDNIWVIDSQGVRSASYSKKLINEKFCLDLFSGILFTSSKKILLTDKRCDFLITLIRKGSLGCSEYELASLVYRDQLFKQEFKESIKNVASQIRKLGLEIKRKKNLYFYDFHKNTMPILFPMNLISRRPLAYCQTQLLTFSAKDIENLLQIKRTSSFLFIKEWKEQGYLIDNVVHQSNGTYSFKEPHN